MSNDRFHHLYVTAADFEVSLTFYRDTLGWHVMQEWGQSGSGRGAMLSGGGVTIVVAETPRGGAEIRPNLHLDIHDVDARFKALPKGTHVVVEPQETQWGTRWFVVRDPDGNLIAFEEFHGG